MAGIGKNLSVAILGFLLAAGIPSLGAGTALAGGGCGHHHGGCGCGCECDYPRDAGSAAPCCGMQDNTAAGHGGMHGMMHGGKGPPPMGPRMGKHVEEMRAAVAKLRAIEAKMATQVKDSEAFRASSLEHAKLLTDLQESHLKHMEGMMGGGK